MSIEDDLRDSLHRRAAAVQPHPDLDGVVARTAAGERRTRRLLTAGLVVALIAGPLAGFAIGSGRDDDGSTVAVGGTAGKEIGSNAGDAALSSPTFGTTEPYEKLFVRTTADGITIRAYRSAAPTAVAVPPTTACPNGADCPVPECTDIVAPESMVVGELSTDAAVTMASGPANQAGGSAVSTATWGTFGVEESAPARWVVASVSTDVTRVRATFPGGTTDEMDPIDGVVLLATQVDDADAAGATLEAFDGAGAVVQHVDLTPGAGGMASASDVSGTPGSATGSAESKVELHTESSAGGSGASANATSSASSSVAGSPGVAPDCIPPVPAPAPAPTLPPPGEQPSDPTTARGQVEQAFAHTYDGSQSMESRQGDVENGDASKIRGDIEASPYAGDVTRSSAKVVDVVFTSPTEASVIYDISVQGGNHFPGRLGKAVLVDGAWKVSGETVCRDLSELLFITCPSK